VTAPDTRRLERAWAAKVITGLVIGCVVTTVLFGILNQMLAAAVALTMGWYIVVYAIVYHAALSGRAPPRPAGDRASLQPVGAGEGGRVVTAPDTRRLKVRSRRYQRMVAHRRRFRTMALWIAGLVTVCVVATVLIGLLNPVAAAIFALTFGGYIVVCVIVYHKDGDLTFSAFAADPCASTVIRWIRARISRVAPVVLAGAVLAGAGQQGPVAAQTIPTPEATEVEEVTQDVWVLRGFIGDKGHAIGFALDCADPTPVVYAHFGSFPTDRRPVQMAVRTRDGSVEVFGARVIGGAGPRSGFHAPQLTDPEDIVRFLAAAFQPGALISNGYRSVWNRVGPDRLGQVEDRIAEACF